MAHGHKPDDQEKIILSVIHASEKGQVSLPHRTIQRIQANQKHLYLTFC